MHKTSSLGSNNFRSQETLHKIHKKVLRHTNKPLDVPRKGHAAVMNKLWPEMRQTKVNNERKTAVNLPWLRMQTGSHTWK